MIVIIIISLHLSDKPRCPSVLCTPECPPNKGPDGCDFCDCGDPCQVNLIFTLIYNKHR